MIRQTHTYLVGAMGGATLIAIAIAVFVVLVSAQVFRDWPIAALGGGEETAAVSKAQPAGGASAGGKAGPIAAGASLAGTAGNANAKQAHGGSGGNGGSVAGHGGVATPGGGQGTTEPAGSGGSGGSQGGDPGSAGSPRSPSSPSPSGSTGTSSSGGGNAGGSGGGGGSGAGGGGGTNGTTPSPTGQVTETVNDTVSGVDEAALGGALNNTGVTAVTEGVVNGVAGPESTVGKVVDETAGAVGGLLHGGH